MFDLKRFRKENGKITQNEMAEMFNCTQGNIYAIEASGRDLTEDQLSILKSRFGEEIVNKYIINIIPKSDSPITLNEAVKSFREDQYLAIIESQQRTIESLSRTVETLSNTLQHQ